jgi:peptidoglycan/xylan/chitin deacetylase (PgdA/CDA1 family)
MSSISTTRAPLQRLRRAVAPAAKTVLFRTGVYGLIRRARPNQRVAILRYHAVCGPEGYEYADPHICVSVDAFRDHVEYLTDHYAVISLDDAVRALRGERALPENAVVLTFDDGYADNLVAAQILHARRATATFYLTADCLAGGKPFWPSEVRQIVPRLATPTLTLVLRDRTFAWLLGNADLREAAIQGVTRLFKSVTIPQRETLRVQLRALAGLEQPLPSPMLTWDQAREMQRLGMSMGAHTLTHPNLPSAGLADATAEIVGAKRRIEQELGTEVTQFSYPNGGAETYYNENLQRAVCAAGYLGSATSRNGFAGPGSDPYALERIQVAERVEDLAFALEVERFAFAPAA